jgi:hypothetical protein
MSASESEPLGSLSGSEQQGDTSRSFQRQPVQTSIEASLAFGLREEQPFELPERLFQQLPFAVFVTGTVSFFATTAALPNYGAGRLSSAIPMSGFADRIECSCDEFARHHYID